mgnify:CR=1 FL=1
MKLLKGDQLIGNKMPNFYCTCTFIFLQNCNNDLANEGKNQANLPLVVIAFGHKSEGQKS